MTLTARTVLRLVYIVVASAALLFLPTWSLHFWQGWIYLVVIVGAWVIFSLWLLRADPQLMERRLQTQEIEPAQKLFQKVGAAIFYPAMLLPGFDFRFGWTRGWLAPVPVWLVLVGQAAALAGSCIIFWTMAKNSFAGQTIQVEAGQRLISDGPYAVVRHPFYAGLMMWVLGTPFALGSYVAVPLFALLVPLIVYRLVNEEKMLVCELAGYVEYCGRTRFRLVPGVW